MSQSPPLYTHKAIEDTNTMGATIVLKMNKIAGPIKKPPTSFKS